jgi:hypothetical protein
VRLIKKLGFATVAAVAAMALTGVSSAMAGNTALCVVHEEPCAAGNTYEGHFEARATVARFLTDITNIACQQSRLLGFALGLNNPQVTHLEQLTFTEDCLTEGGFPCVVESVELGLMLLLRIALNLGSVRIHNTKILVSCPGAEIHCVFGGLPILHALGSPNGESLAEIHGNEVELEVAEGFFCPEEAKLDVLYKVFLPDPVAITG